MLATKQSYDDQIWKRIDALLDSSVDLDQIAILESEMVLDSEKITPTCSALLQKVEGYAKANAGKIQEARELILSMR